MISNVIHYKLFNLGSYLGIERVVQQIKIAAYGNIIALPGKAKIIHYGVFVGRYLL
jgi:hypothetical protein